VACGIVLDDRKKIVTVEDVGDGGGDVASDEADIGTGMRDKEPE
jgi:hypothetical protein